MSDEQKPSESHWLLKAMVIAFFTAIASSLAGGVTTALGLYGAGLVRVTTTDTGIIVTIVIAALIISIAMFVLGVRLCVSIALSFIVSLYRGFRGFTGLKAAQAAAPSWQAAQPASAPLLASTPDEPTAWRERASEAFWTVVVMVILWLFVPRRFRKWLSSSTAKPAKQT